jgi:hypothetical protein
MIEDRRALLAPPNWSHIPEELKVKDRWVVWKLTRGSKVPYSCRSPRRRVDATRADSGSCFNEAEEAYGTGQFAGVGFILAGEGIVAADLDDCVEGGVLKTGVKELLDELGASYVELSPTGTGLRVLGRSQEIFDGRHLSVHGIHLELYGRKRFVTITGHLLPGFKSELSLMPGYLTFAGATRHPSPGDASARNRLHERTSEARALEIASAAGKLTLPAKCVPIGPRERHKCLFELARFLKGRLPDAEEDELHEILQAWHASVQAVIRTKEFADSWAEFVGMWPKVTTVHGEVLDELVSAPLPDLPAWMRGHRFGQRGDKLLRICLALAEHHSPDPFFLASRPIAPYLDCHFTHVASILGALVTCGYLDLVEQGGLGTASSYRIGSRRKTPFGGDPRASSHASDSTQETQETQDTQELRNRS